MCYRRGRFRATKLFIASTANIAVNVPDNTAFNKPTAQKRPGFTVFTDPDCKNAKMSEKSVFSAILYWLLFVIVRLIFAAIDGARVWFKTALTPRSNAFASSARLDKVISTNIFDPWVSPNQPSNIISRHVKYVHPCYVLKDEVSFYCLTKSEAWFVEAPEGVEVWKSCFSPFHKIAQLEHAVNVIRMPLQSLYRLTNEMDDIEAKIVFIEFMARSGSTLFLQMFEETEECVTYSEPHYFNHYGRPEFADEDCRLEAVMKMYCKPRKLPTTAFVFKSILIGKTLSPAVHRLFPQAKFVYIYRNLIPNALSMDKINKKILFHRVDSAIRNIHPTIFWRMHKLMMNNMAFPYTEIELDIAKKSDWSQGIIMYYYLLKVHAFYLQLQNRNDHPKTPSVKYEHLIKDPDKCLTAVFKHCDLSLALVPKALRALHKDSQRGSILAQETLNKREQDPRLVAKELLDIVEELADEMGLNDLWGEFQLGHDVCDS